MYEYKFKPLRVIDGDTVEILIDLGCHVSRTEIVRLYGINAKELNSKVAEERQQANAVKAALAEALNTPGLWTVRTLKDKDDKYGRLLAIFMRDGININDYLLTLPGVEAYFGKGH